MSKIFNINTFDKEEIIFSYRDNGYLLFENLISKNEQKEILLDLSKINRGEYKIKGSIIDPVDWPLSDKRLLSRYMYIGDPHTYSTVIHKYIFHKGLTTVLDHITGSNVPFWNGAYKCIQTMFVNKKPGGNGSPWHQDESAIITRDRSLVGVWIALTETNTQNGCLWIIPNSHRSGILYKRYEHNELDVDSMPLARGFDSSKSIPIEMNPLSVLFFSGYLLHNSRKNISNEHRPSLTLHYCNSSSYLPWRGAINYRGVVQVKGDDPYESQGYILSEPWFRKE